MTVVSAEDVRQFLVDRLRQDVPQECDLLLSGIVDSLGLLELITAVADHFGREIDFEALDPEKMTIVGPFCEFVSRQLCED